MECPVHVRATFHPWIPAVRLWSALLLAAGGAPLVLCGQTPATPGAQVSAVATNQPLVPGFNVSRYEIIGRPVFTPEQVNGFMSSALGTNVSLPQIRRGLVRLQEAYRERGFTKAAVTLPRQSLTDGVVKVQVIEGPGAAEPVTAVAPSTELPAWIVPTYDVQHFEVRGNTALKPEEIDQILGPIAGTNVSLEQIQKALARLQTAYRERGHTRAVVTLRQQVLTDGTLAIEINEGRTLAAELAERFPATNAAPVPARPLRTFEVRHYEITGNTLLKQGTLEQVLTNAIGTNVTLPQIQKALGDLQLAYRERGYATVGVGLPQQQITNGIVKVTVTEGVLSEVQVFGNRYFSTANVKRALPGLRTNELLNSRTFEHELNIANQNRDRQIFPTIGPGPDPGSSALTLRVKDRLPLHGRVEVNNQSTPGTPDWRINTSLSYANLWQREHQLGLSYGFSPQEYKSGGLTEDYFFNRPLVANFGAYYRLPFGSAASVQEQVASSSGRFGYDEATRQFRLPPAGARPDLSIYGSASSSDTGVKYGPSSVVARNPLLTITSQDSGQNIDINNSVGGRVNVPWVLSEQRRFSFSGGLDAKYYSSDGYNTNNFTIVTVVTNSQGSQTIKSVVSSPQPVRTVELAYLPLALGADYFQTDRQGTFSATLGLNVNFVGNDDDFVAASYSSETDAAYAKVTLSLTRDQKIFRDWSLLARAGGQLATGPLISNEQFALGGLNTVRGYYEGEQYGDTGVFGSLELRTPFIASEVPIWSGRVPVWLRGSIFFDAGHRGLAEASAEPYQSLLGTGFSLSANINNYVDTRITVGVPLKDSFFTEACEPRVHFSLGAQF